MEGEENKLTKSKFFTLYFYYLPTAQNYNRENIQDSFIYLLMQFFKNIVITIDINLYIIPCRFKVTFSKKLDLELLNTVYFNHGDNYVNTYKTYG